jgi:hypothetical protein
MVKFIGNCSDIIDWNSVIADLEKQEPGYIGPRHDVGYDVPGVEEVARPLRDAGYKMGHEGGNARWGMFFPGTHFDKLVVDKFLQFVGIEDYINCWISKVAPGDVAPWHWDITDDEATLALESKGLVRFHCHVSPPTHGHIFIVEDTCLYNRAQGDVFQWPDRKSWHAGANAGLTPKYTFNLWR